jgi:plastocyanin domain-containing protein
MNERVDNRGRGYIFEGDQCECRTGTADDSRLHPRCAVDTGDVLVVLGGLGAIAWVNWYFFLAGGSTGEARVGAGGVQEVNIRVLGGYDPAHIRVKQGVPVRLVFDRQETSGCSEEVVLPEFGIRKFLPPHERTVVEFTPGEPGTYEFTCGMSMLRGRLTVEEEGSGS